MSLPNAPQVLKEFKAVLGDKMILAYGTVLWLIRDGMLHDAPDDDEDTFVFGEHLTGKVIGDLINAGFVVNGVYPMADGRIGEISFKKDGVKVDIYVAHKNGNERFWCMYDGTHLYHKIPAYMLENPISLDWEGESWLIPSPVEDYLEETYGNWKEHADYFDWRYDHKCYDKGFDICKTSR